MKVPDGTLVYELANFGICVIILKRYDNVLYFQLEKQQMKTKLYVS